MWLFALVFALCGVVWVWCWCWCWGCVGFVLVVCCDRVCCVCVCCVRLLCCGVVLFVLLFVVVYLVCFDWFEWGLACLFCFVFVHCVVFCLLA